MMIHSMDPIGASLVESLVANHILLPQPSPLLLPPAAVDKENDNHQNGNDNTEKNIETAAVMMENKEEEEAPVVAVVAPPLITTPFPSRYHHDSLLLTAAYPPKPRSSSSSRGRGRRRNCLLIKGPEKSGRTSLLLDLAMSLASKTPCRCFNNNPQQRNSSSSRDNDDAATEKQEDDEDAQVFECQCVAVTIFRPASVETTSRTEIGGQDEERHDGENENNNSDGHVDEYDTEEFPLFCHRMHVPTTSNAMETTATPQHGSTVANNNNTLLETNTNQPTNTATTTTLDNNKENKTSANDDNNLHLQNKEQALLSRIQVHHVTSARQILSYLLQAQGFSPQEQPWGGILIDDLHCFGRSSNSNNNNADYNVVLLSQVVALLADTANWIENSIMPTTEMSPMTIAVSLLDNAISTKWTDHFWSSLFLDQIVTIVPSTQRSPQDWYKDLVSTTTTTTTTMTAQQQHSTDWFHSSNHRAATNAMNVMSLTPTTPITSWSIQVQQQQQQQRQRGKGLQQDEPHPKQQKRFHSLQRHQAVVEYAIIMQDDDYNGHGGSIVWKTAAVCDDDDDHNDTEHYNINKS